MCPVPSPPTLLPAVPPSPRGRMGRGRGGGRKKKAGNNNLRGRQKGNGSLLSFLLAPVAAVATRCYCCTPPCAVQSPGRKKKKFPRGPVLCPPFCSTVYTGGRRGPQDEDVKKKKSETGEKRIIGWVGARLRPAWRMREGGLERKGAAPRFRPSSNLAPSSTDNFRPPSSLPPPSPLPAAAAANRLPPLTVKTRERGGGKDKRLARGDNN